MSHRHNNNDSLCRHIAVILILISEPPLSLSAIPSLLCTVSSSHHTLPSHHTVFILTRIHTTSTVLSSSSSSSSLPPSPSSLKHHHDYTVRTFSLLHYYIIFAVIVIIAVPTTIPTFFTYHPSPRSSSPTHSLTHHCRANGCPTTPFCNDKNKKNGIKNQITLLLLYLPRVSHHYHIHHLIQQCNHQLFYSLCHYPRHR